MNSRTSMAQREEVIKRTVYVSDIDQQVELISLSWFSAILIALMIVTFSFIVH